MIDRNSKYIRFIIRFFWALTKVIITLVILTVIAINWDMVAMGKVVRGKYFVGLIVKDDSKAPEEWTPTKELVLSLEDDLQKYITQTLGKDNWIAEHLPEYKVQYWGYICDGKKTLQIDFHHNSTVKYGFWKIPFGVLGGGRNHFKVTCQRGSSLDFRSTMTPDDVQPAATAVSADAL
jgi:hypothetical protein